MDFDPFCVSLFQGSSLVIIIMIDGSEKHNCEGGFLSYFEKNSSYVSDVSVCILVALYLCGFVCWDVCCKSK